MYRTEKLLLSLLCCMLMTVCGTFRPVAADDEGYEHGKYRHQEKEYREHEGREYEHEEYKHEEFENRNFEHRGEYPGENIEYNERHKGLLKPVGNQIYQEQCGACHMAYLPELMPSASWIKIMASLDNHFGEDVAIDDASKKEISDYLKSDAAEKTRAKHAYKIMQSLGDQVPERITDVPYIKKKHMGIPPDFFNSNAIGSFSNCIACHPTAEEGIFDDEHVKIPR